MVRATQNELKLFYGNVDGFKKGDDDELVVISAEFDELDRSFEVVEEAMDIG